MKFHNRIVSIGDIHGDFTIFKRLLYMCNVIDKTGNWTGGSTYVIQMGDTLDGKRPGVKMNNAYMKESGELEIILYILMLDSQAKMSGGRVISILGNHEMYPYYIGNDKKFIQDYIKKSDINVFNKHGINRIKFFKPGEAGGILFGRTRPLLLQLGEFLFIHGSITDSLIKYNTNNLGEVDVNKINKDTSMWLMGKGKIPKYLEDAGENNPIFSRSYSDSKTITKVECNKIRKQVSKFRGVKHVVMGHSSYSTINSTCDKMLVRTDVSLSRAFGGNLDNKKLEALEIIQRPNSDPIISIISPTHKTSLK